MDKKRLWILISLVVYGAYTVLLVAFGAWNPAGISTPLTTIFDGALWEVVFFPMLIPLACFLACACSLGLLPAAFWGSNVTLRRKHEVAKVVVTPQWRFRSLYRRGLLAAFVTFSIASLFKDFKWALQFLYNISLDSSDAGVNLTFLLTFSQFLLPFIAFLFSFLWAWNASGLVLVKRENPKKTTRRYIQGIGHHYLVYYKGLLGFGLVIAYFAVNTPDIFTLAEGGDYTGAILRIALTIAHPFFLGLAAIPSIIFVDFFVTASQGWRDKVDALPDLTAKYHQFAVVQAKLVEKATKEGAELATKTTKGGA